MALIVGQLKQFYSTKFYHEQIKDDFEARFAAEKRKAARNGDPAPTELKIRRIVTSEVWDAETPAMRAEVKEALERDYKKRLKAWEESLADSPTRTAEEMAATLDNAAYYLQPFVDAIMQRFGIVHAGETRGLAPQIWPLHDKVGFGEVEKSMVAFAKDCFSEADCRARIVGGSGAPCNAVASGSKTGDVDVEMTDVDVGATTAGSGTVEGAAAAGVTAGVVGPATAAGATPITATNVTPTSVFAQAPSGGAPGAAVGAEAGAPDAAAGAEAGAPGTAATRPNVETLVEVTSGMAEVAAGGSGTAEDEELARCEEIWRRGDRAEWSPELGRAHVAFERGRGWGTDWAYCVDAFMEFEAVCGYKEDGAQITSKGRPTAVKVWLGRARNWDSTMKLGELGKEGQEGTFADDFWNWWTSLQPPERVAFNGSLSRPGDADWSGLLELHGKNGVLQVMAALLWWGEALLWWGEALDEKEDPFGRMDWRSVVDDVRWACLQMAQAKLTGVKGKKRKPGKAIVDDSAKQPENKRRTRAAAEEEQVQTRSTRSSSKAVRGKHRTEFNPRAPSPPPACED
ncbi:hypothetical protein DFH07DRAFT_971923 [Mycena maculata]|uniref:Uncharacterized protein n=1 Tax=Mycena maculata TaxID=230809 RepID=A0AAD7MM68_9AGAR|nr:hypothetical protein DFH07DRAFT_971923 [Mycena maculata]